MASSHATSSGYGLRRWAATTSAVALAAFGLVRWSALSDPGATRAPAGRYQVATRQVEWSAPSGRRDSMDVWYPVTAAGHPVPVLLFSPGYGQTPLGYSVFLSSVASHGYVVLGVRHRYKEPFTWVSNVGPLGADLIAALDHASAARDARAPVFAQLDLTRVGAFGHSFGGSVAAEACVRDRRIRAEMDLDGSIFGRAVEQGTPCPFFMLMGSLPWIDRFRLEPPRFFVDRDQAFLHEQRVFTRSATAYWLTVRRLDHMSFADAALDPSLGARVAELAGARLDAARTHQLSIRYVRAFFDHYVSGAPAASELSQSPVRFATLKVHRR